MPVWLRCFAIICLERLALLQEGFGAVQNQPTNSDMRAAAAMGDEASYHKVHGASTLFSAQAAGARVRPNSQLNAPKPTQLQNTMLDYGDV